MVDNNSPDGSGQMAAHWAQGLANGRMLQNETNLYFCEANNRGAELATGEFLLFLNNDLWLEADCLEKLYQETKAAQADAATPLVLNYNDDTFQGLGGPGLDVFGLATAGRFVSKTRAGNFLRLRLQPTGQSRRVQKNWRLRHATAHVCG